MPAYISSSQFTTSSTSGTLPYTVQFNDTSSTTFPGGTPTEWLWDFGDGTTSTLKSPSHTYTTPVNGNSVGTRTVILKNNMNSTPIASATGITKTLTVFANLTTSFTYTNIPDSLVADFIAVIPTDVNSSSVKYSWDFGDGTSDIVSGTTVSHTYAEAGSYTVSLITSPIGTFTGTAPTFNAPSQTVTPTVTDVPMTPSGNVGQLRATGLKITGRVKIS